jgi:antitoxin FitA
MISVQITGVPEGTHAVLLERAARADQSLQEYLLGLLVREANSPTLDEVLDRADNRTGGRVSFSEGVQAVRGDRDRR